MDSNTKKIFINKYNTVGEEKFYKFLITYALNKLVYLKKDSYSPASELLDYYEMFLKLYRKDNDNIYLELAKQFRKAAHKIYRIVLKKGLVDRNKKFLNVV